MPESLLTRAKRTLKPLVRAGLDLLPNEQLADLTARVPWIAGAVPDGRRIVINDFLGEFTLELDTTHPLERWALRRFHDRRVHALIARAVRPGDVCVDVGANYGGVTFALAQASAPAGRVYSFEPGPVNHERLTRNLALNPSLRDRVVAYALGVADKPGTLRWSEDPSFPGNACMFGTEGIERAVVTLDEALKDLPRVDFIKIDVEGMEIEVLRGASALITRHRPILFYETVLGFAAGRGRPLFEEIAALLDGLGYARFDIHEGGRLTPAGSTPGTLDTLALPQQRST